MHLLNCVSHMQSEIEQRPFWFRRKFEKRALLFYRVFRNLSFGNLLGFLRCEAIRIPAFFIFKKGAGSQLPIFSRSPLCGKDGFFVFRVNYQRLKKGAGEYGGKKWRIKWVPSQWESDRNTVLIQALPVLQKSLYARRLLCVRGVHFPAMDFCARAGTGSVCARDWWNYLIGRKKANEYAVS